MSHRHRVVAANILYLVVAAADAAVIRVPANFPTIQEAIDHAVRGDTVLVAPGTYDGPLQWTAKGITLTSEAGAASTIIDGQGARQAVYMYVAGGAGPDRHATLSGFTIRGGAEYGVLAVGGRPIIEDDIITGTTQQGCCWQGAIYAEQTKIVVRRNLVEYNAGPGIVLNYAEHSLVEENRVRFNGGGGIMAFAGDDVTVLRNIVTRNSWSALDFDETTNLRVADNLIVRNDQPPSDALEVWNSVSGTIVDNTFADNGDSTSVWFFDDLPRLVFANNVVSASSRDAALMCTGGSGPVFSSDDVWNAVADAVGGECVDAFLNSRGDFSLEPRFRGSGDSHRWKPAADSPLVDAGDNDQVQGLHRDLSRKPRIIDGGHGAVVDIGAYEFDPG
jgi:hypothetical protein